jgi:hypothetical protein
MIKVLKVDIVPRLNMFKPIRFSIAQPEIFSSIDVFLDFLIG